MSFERRRRPIDSIIRLRRRRELSPTVAESEPPRESRRVFGTTTTLLSGFTILILGGGALLTLPLAHNGPGFTSMEIAYFTSVSAVTVTGHTAVDTSTYWSTFGQAVIFVLMLVGGLGFMVVSTFILLLIGQRSTLQERLLNRALVGVDRLQGLRQLGRAVTLMVFLLYIAGAAVIFWQIHGIDGLGTAKTLWHSLFLSVSSFNNAGFNIIPEVPAGSSVARFVSNPILLMTMTVLIILGGLGWVVVADIFSKRRFSRFSLETKLVLVTSILLWALGAWLLYLAEFSNSATMGSFSWVDKIVTAVFQSVSARTAGFSVVDLGQAKDVTKSTFSGLMFIGGAAGSAAGGIKVATFAVLMAAVISSLRGRPHTEAFGREIHQSQLHRALTVAVLGLALAVISATMLTTLEPDIPFLDIIFDTVSAFATVGNSTGIIPDTGLASKVVFMVLMYVGRFGPMALALALSTEDDTEEYRFAQEGVRIG